MAAALVRVDVVGEGEDRLLVGGVPLHCDLDGALVALAREIDDLLADRLLVLVEVGDEVLDPTLVAELFLRAGAALVDQRDAQAAREKRRLAQAVLERADVEVDRLEDLGVGQERHGQAGALALRQRPALGDVALRRSTHVVLSPDVAVAANLDMQTLRQRVDYRHTDAMQATGDLVAAAVTELATRVERREHNLERRAALLLHQRYRDAAPVVNDGDRVVGADRDRDRITEAGERLVHRVVHNLIHKVVQTTFPG